MNTIIISKTRQNVWMFLLVVCMVAAAVVILKLELEGFVFVCIEWGREIEN